MMNLNNGRYFYLICFDYLMKGDKLIQFFKMSLYKGLYGDDRCYYIKVGYQDV